MGKTENKTESHDHPPTLHPIHQPTTDNHPLIHLEARGVPRSPLVTVLRLTG